MKEQTKKEIQQKLADYRQPAPEVSWAELEKALAANRKAKAVVMWPKRLAAAAVVLLMVGFGWWASSCPPTGLPRPPLGCFWKKGLPIAVSRTSPCFPQL